MGQLNSATIFEEAERDGLVFRMKPGWKKYFLFTGILMCLMVITLPLGIWFMLIPKSARLGVGKEGFAVKWFGTSTYAYADIQEFSQASLQMNVGGGIVGALVGAAVSSAVAAKTSGLKGPLHFKLKGKWGWSGVPAQAIERSDEMARELEKRTGLQIFPKVTDERKA